MNRIWPKLGLLLFALALAASASAGDMVDRLVAAVDNVPILQSDWDHAVAVEALQQGRKIASFTESERRAVLNRLVDQQLIRGQMGDDRIAAADAPEITNQVAKLRASYEQAKSDEGWKALLQQYGVDEQMLRMNVARELQIMRFLDLRLRPETRVERADVEAYYTNTLLPEVRKAGGKEEDLTAAIYRKIEEILRQQRMDSLLVPWLQDLYEHSDIQWLIAKPNAGDAAPVAGAGGHF